MEINHNLQSTTSISVQNLMKLQYIYGILQASPQSEFRTCLSFQTEPLHPFPVNTHVHCQNQTTTICILPLCNSLFWGYFIKGATKCIWFLSPTLVLQVFLFTVVIYPLCVLMHFQIVSYPILVLTAHTPNLALCS